MDWNYVRVDRTRDDFTMGINMTVEEARAALDDLHKPVLPLSQINPATRLLFEALYSAAYQVEKRQDASEGFQSLPSKSQSDPQSERDITDESSSPGA